MEKSTQAATRVTGALQRDGFSTDTPGEAASSEPLDPNTSSLPGTLQPAFELNTEGGQGSVGSNHFSQYLALSVPYPHLLLFRTWNCRLWQCN